MLWLSLSASLAAGIGLSPAARAQSATDRARLYGVVVDSARQPISNASVRVRGGSEAAITDSMGTFAFGNLRPGSVTLQVRRLGYEPRELTLDLHAEETRRVEVRLDIAAQTLAPAVVTARPRTLNLGLQDFEQRRRLGRGQFITSDEFGKWAPQSVVDVLRHLSGMRIADSSGVKLAISTRGEKVALVHGIPEPVVCVMRTALDGQLMPWGYDLQQEGIDNVAAIEVYSGPASIPPQFNSAHDDTWCGLVMIWLK